MIWSEALRTRVPRLWAGCLNSPHHSFIENENKNHHTSLPKLLGGRSDIKIYNDNIVHKFPFRCFL